MTNTNVKEISIFQAKDGISNEEVLKVATSLTPMIAKMDGFIDRELTFDKKNNSFVCIINWENQEKVDKAMAQMMSSPDSAKLFAIIGGENAKMMFLESKIKS